MEKIKYDTLMKIVNHPDSHLLHVNVHNAILRQLIDAAEISNLPMTEPRGRYWLKEVDFG